MHDDVVWLEPVDLARIVIRHELEVAVAVHRALRLSGRAGGVEKPGEIVGRASLVAIDGITSGEALFIRLRPCGRASDADKGFDRIQLTANTVDAGGEIVAKDKRFAAGVL